MRRIFFRAGACASLVLGLLLLAGCASYYPGYSYTYAGAGAYYAHPYSYYGRYPAGWFAAGPYFPGNYWGFGAMVYWPTYASSYYYSNHYYGGSYYYGRYYPYSDPWYYGYAGRYPHVYGHYYSPWNGPYYGYSSGANHGYPYNRPYPGSSSGYRPDRAPDYPTDRRSTTVVTQRAGMARSVSVAPGRQGNSGMVVSSRSDRKTEPSRLHPVAPSAPQINASSAMGNYHSSGQPSAPLPSRRSMDNSRGGFRLPSGSAPSRPDLVPAPSRPEPTYQHRLDSNSIQPRSEPRQPNRDDSSRGRQRDRDRHQRPR